MSNLSSRRRSSSSSHNHLYGGGHYIRHTPTYGHRPLQWKVRDVYMLIGLFFCLQCLHQWRGSPNKEVSLLDESFLLGEDANVAKPAAAAPEPIRLERYGREESLIEHDGDDDDDDDSNKDDDNKQSEGGELGAGDENDDTTSQERAGKARDDDDDAVAVSQDDEETRMEETNDKNQREEEAKDEMMHHMNHHERQVKDIQNNKSHLRTTKSTTVRTQDEKVEQFIEEYGQELSHVRHYDDDDDDATTDDHDAMQEKEHEQELKSMLKKGHNKHSDLDKDQDVEDSNIAAFVERYGRPDGMVVPHNDDDDNTGVAVDNNDVPHNGAKEEEAEERYLQPKQGHAHDADDDNYRDDDEDLFQIAINQHKKGQTIVLEDSPEDVDLENEYDQEEEDDDDHDQTDRDSNQHTATTQQNHPHAHEIEAESLKSEEEEDGNDKKEHKNAMMESPQDSQILPRLRGSHNNEVWKDYVHCHELGDYSSKEQEESDDNKRCCALWATPDSVVEEWWVHHAEWEVATQDSEQVCFAHSASLTNQKARLGKRPSFSMLKRQWQNEQTRQDTVKQHNMQTKTTRREIKFDIRDQQKYQMERHLQQRKETQQ